jgi:hypothetical protein
MNALGFGDSSSTGTANATDTGDMGSEAANNAATAAANAAAAKRRRQLGVMVVLVRMEGLLVQMDLLEMEEESVCMMGVVHLIITMHLNICLLRIKIYLIILMRM